MKKLLIVTMLLTLLMCGCGKTDDSYAPTTEKEETTKTESVEAEVEETKETESEEERLKRQMDEAKAVLEACEIEVLASSVIEYDKAEINGYGAYSEDYDKATILTIGMKFADKYGTDYLKGFKVCGETAMDANGEPAIQTYWDTNWISEYKDYILAIIRVAGEVDPTKVKIILTGKLDGVEVEKSFTSGGTEVGFASAIEAFMDEEDEFSSVSTKSSVVKLQGRHYLRYRLYNSGSGWTGKSDGTDISRETHSFVLLPLEKWGSNQLDETQMELICETEVANTTCELLVNESGVIDASTLDIQNTIEIEVSRVVVESKDADGNYSDEAYDNMEKDIKALMKATTVKLDDGDGNTVILDFME